MRFMNKRQLEVVQGETGQRDLTVLFHVTMISRLLMKLFLCNRKPKKKKSQMTQLHPQKIELIST